MSFSADKLIQAAKEYQSQDHLLFDKDRLANDRKRELYGKYPHLFVLCCLMDKQIDAGRAWNIPFEICEAFKKWSVDDLNAIGKEEYRDCFQRMSLHRFNNEMATVFKSAIVRIANEYQGDASMIWKGNLNSASVVYRFLEFDGCGIKIATMATNLLHRGLGVTYSDYSSIDISPDVHILRVMKRLGLVEKGQNKRELAIYRARELSPSYPGLIDGFFWYLGNEYCRPREPRCLDCSICDICEKTI